LHFFSSSARWNFTTGPRWRHEIGAAESYNHEFNSNALADFFDANDPSCAPRSPTAVPAIACDFPFVGANQYNRSGLHAQSSYLLPRFGATAGYQYEVENGYVSALNLSTRGAIARAVSSIFVICLIRAHRSISVCARRPMPISARA